MLSIRKAQSIQAIYLYLTLGNTLAASFIWGINTIFLLSAGLSNFQAFAANAFFTLGEVIFEVPTGIIADTYGRRVSYLLGAFTLSLSTFLYLIMWKVRGPFWGWAASSILLGLGFTFFSGALEAWLVDGLKATGFKGSLDGVFAKGQMVGGFAMLSGSIAGGVIAQTTNLGVPYILRSLVLILNFATAFFLMRDLGFKPQKMGNPLRRMKNIFDSSIENGIKHPPVRWVMLAAPFTAGVSFYVFYALQPYLLQLYGNNKAYAIAGLVAAIIGLTQIAGGLLSPHLRRLFGKRTSALIVGTLLTGVLLLLVGNAHNFYIALAIIFVWGLIFAAITPIRQSYLNGLIPSEQRATVLSFDSMIGSTGGIIIQPILGKTADIWGYSSSYLVSSIFEFGAIPLLFLARRTKPKSDPIDEK